MARRRYYRRSVRVVPAKKKWATCMNVGAITATGSSGSTSPAPAVAVHGQDILVRNSSQSSTPTPVVVKAGNFKIQGDCVISATTGPTATTSVIVYIVYLPEVVMSSANVLSTISDHPEWIMAWKLVDVNTSSSSTTNSNSFSFSSRLKRNLNSGDGIAIVAVLRDATPPTGNTYTVRLNYNAQWWTCSN